METRGNIFTTQHNISPQHITPQNHLNLGIFLPNWSPQGKQTDSHDPCIFSSILKTKSQPMFFLSTYFLQVETVRLRAA